LRSPERAAEISRLGREVMSELVCRIVAADVA
jgi:hypothetical protein